MKVLFIMTNYQQMPVLPIKQCISMIEVTLLRITIFLFCAKKTDVLRGFKETVKKQRQALKRKKVSALWKLQWSV